MNSAALSPGLWQWRPVMQPQIQTGSPWSGTSCCCVSCLDGNSTQMFGCIIMLWCTCKSWYRFSPFPCWYIHLKGNRNAPSGPHQSSLPVFPATTLMILTLFHLISMQSCCEYLCQGGLHHGKMLCYCIFLSQVPRNSIGLWSNFGIVAILSLAGSRDTPKRLFPIHNHQKWSGWKKMNTFFWASQTSQNDPMSLYRFWFSPILEKYSEHIGLNRFFFHPNFMYPHINCCISCGKKTLFTVVFHKQGDLWQVEVKERKWKRCLMSWQLCSRVSQSD